MILDEAKAVLDRQNEKGLAKYGGSLDETTPSLQALCDHRIEEHADALIYAVAERAEVRKLLGENERLRAALTEALTASTTTVHGANIPLLGKGFRERHAAVCDALVVTEITPVGEYVTAKSSGKREDDQ